MARRRDNVNFTLIIGTIIVSALLHALLWPVGDEVLRTSWTRPPAPSDGVMEVSLLGPEAPPPQEPEVVPDDTELVQLDQVDKERPPPPTRHRAEFDNRVEKETKAPNRRPTPGAPAQTPGQPDDKPNDTPKPSDEASARSLDLNTRGKAEPDAGVLAADGELAELARGQAEPKGSRPPGGGMLGTPEAMQKTFGSTGTFDALEDVEPGAANILNSKRSRYASFFNRVRNGIAQHWEPAQVHRARDPDGRVFGAKTRRTHLVIRLNGDGTLAKIMLLEGSGAPHLDEEAIRAVRQAVPFYNPPAGLIDPTSGFIEFGFGFIFELNKKPRIFRYRR